MRQPALAMMILPPLGLGPASKDQDQDEVAVAVQDWSGAGDRLQARQLVAMPFVALVRRLKKAWRSRVGVEDQSEVRR